MALPSRVRCRIRYVVHCRVRYHEARPVASRRSRKAAARSRPVPPMRSTAEE